MAVPDVRAMTPEERRRAFSRAVGLRRRLEARQRDGVLTAAQANELRETRLMLSALDKVGVPLRGTTLTLPQARARRAELRRRLGIVGRRSKSSPEPGMSSQECDAAREELKRIEVAIRANATSAEKKPQHGRVRTQPTRVTSVVHGGLPGLGGR